MKRATLIRFYHEQQDKTIGLLQVKGEAGAVYTMEPGAEDPAGARVPDGTYLAEWIYSPKFGNTWTLVGDSVSAEPEIGVDRNQIRIHTGNDDEESQGCILPGMALGWDHTDGEPTLLNSRDAFRKLKIWIGERDFLLVIRSGQIPASVA